MFEWPVKLLSLVSNQNVKGWAPAVLSRGGRAHPLPFLRTTGRAAAVGVGMRQNWGAKEKSNWDISCSSPHFCLSCTYVLISFLFIIGFFCLFVCFLLSPETPFHFTLPKEGDIIPPLTGATPPLIGHLKLEPKRHSTPIGEWLNVMMFKAEFLRYHSIRQWFFYIWGVGPAWWDWFLS